MPYKNRMIRKAAWRYWEVRWFCSGKKEFIERLKRYLEDGFTAADFIGDIFDEYYFQEELRELRDEQIADSWRRLQSQ